MLRASYPSMQNVAKKILLNQRSKEASKNLLSINEILNLILAQNSPIKKNTTGTIFTKKNCPNKINPICTICNVKTKKLNFLSLRYRAWQ